MLKRRTSTRKMPSSSATCACKWRRARTAATTVRAAATGGPVTTASAGGTTLTHHSTPDRYSMWLANGVWGWDGLSQFGREMECTAVYTEVYEVYWTFQLSKLWKAKFSILCDIYFWWGCRGNLKLITLRSDWVNGFGVTGKREKKEEKELSGPVRLVRQVRLPIFVLFLFHVFYLQHGGKIVTKRELTGGPPVITIL